LLPMYDILILYLQLRTIKITNANFSNVVFGIIIKTVQLKIKTIMKTPMYDPTIMKFSSHL